MPRQRSTEHRMDDMTDAYDDWVAECVSVQQAYEFWFTAGSEEAPIAFAVYRAALDREECASQCFAALAA